MKKYTLFTLTILFTSTISFSQLLPVGFIPLERNGSFAGMADQGRLTLNVNQTFETSTKAYGYYASYDKFIKSLSTGIGLTAYRFKYEPFLMSDSRQVYSGNRLELAIAPKLSVKGKYTVSPSVKVTYGTSHEFSTLGKEVIDRDLENFEVTTGLGLNTTKYYLGYAVRFFKKNEENLFTGEPFSTADFYSVLEGGYSFSGREDSKFSFTPQVAIHLFSKNRVSDFDINVNARFQISNFIFGHTFRSYQSTRQGLFGAYIGFQRESFRAVLLFDSFRSLELNVRFLIPNKDKKRKPVFW